MSTQNSDGSKTMSLSVRRLQDALNVHLDATEKAEFVEILNRFHVSRDMFGFTKSLKRLLDTPTRKQLFRLIRKVIPQADVDAFDRYVHRDGGKFDTVPTKRSQKTQRSRPPLPSDGSSGFLALSKQKKQNKINGTETIKSKLQDSSPDNRTKSHKRSTEQKLLKYNPGKAVKTVKSALKADKTNDIKHILIQSGDADRGFGFSIRGGVDFGVGVYVSMVDDGGPADLSGLLPGDLILEANCTSFRNVRHDEAAEVNSICCNIKQTSDKEAFFYFFSQYFTLISMRGIFLGYTLSG